MTYVVPLGLIPVERVLCTGSAVARDSVVLAVCRISSAAASETGSAKGLVSSGASDLASESVHVHYTKAKANSFRIRFNRHRNRV